MEWAKRRARVAARRTSVDVALDDISEKLCSELARREKLQQKKFCLMRDQLTDKVPVEVEAPEVVDG